MCFGVGERELPWPICVCNMCVRYAICVCNMCVCTMYVHYVCALGWTSTASVCVYTFVCDCVCVCVCVYYAHLAGRLGSTRCVSSTNCLSVKY